MDYRELKDTLCYELEVLAKKSNINSVDLEKIQKLTSAIKNLYAIEGMDDYRDGYSYNKNSSYNNSASYDGNYNNSNRNRDSRDRYSRQGHEKEKIVEHIREMMSDRGINSSDKDTLRRAIEVLDR